MGARVTANQLTLIKMALEYLSGQNGTPAEYARRVKGQIDLMHNSGEPPKTQDWVTMAKVLSSQALSRDIGPRRIADAIYPLIMDANRQFMTPIAYIPAPYATNKLLSFTGIKVEPEIKTLLVGVIKELQGMVKHRAKPTQNMQDNL